MKFGKLLAACALATSMGMGLSVPSLIQATYKNHIDILSLKAEALRREFKIYSNMDSMMGAIVELHPRIGLPLSEPSASTTAHLKISKEAFYRDDTDNPYLNRLIRADLKYWRMQYLDGAARTKIHPEQMRKRFAKEAAEFATRLITMPSFESVSDQHLKKWHALVFKNK